MLKHYNLMLSSERRERLEAWAASDQPISHRQYQRRVRRHSAVVILSVKPKTHFCLRDDSFEPRRLTIVPRINGCLEKGYRRSQAQLRK